MSAVWPRLRPVQSVGGVKLPIDVNLSPKIVQQIVDATYEQDEVALLARHLRPDDTVLELGAGIGFLSAFCAARIGSDRVHAFEANPALESIIQRTYALNDVAPALTMSVLGRAPGFVPFFVERDFWSSSLVRRSPSAQRVDVPVQSAQDVIDAVRPTLMVIDIEGGEAELFEYLDVRALRAILIELHPHVIGRNAVDRVRATLRSARFYPASGGDTDCVEMFLNETWHSS